MLSPQRWTGAAVPDSRGFTLVEVVVAVVVIGLLAAVVLPQVISRLVQGEAAALAQNLSAVSGAVQRFRGDVGRFPSQLVQLTTPVTTTSTDLCGSTIRFPERWRGPYLDRVIPATGLRAGTATIHAQLIRDPGTYAASRDALLYIVAIGVDQEVAEQLEAAFDGDADFSGGAIRWAPLGDGLLAYAIPIRGC